MSRSALTGLAKDSPSVPRRVSSPISRPTGGGKEGSGPTMRLQAAGSSPGTPGGASRSTGSQGAAGGASTASVQTGEAPEEPRLSSGPAAG
ncbi:hypothetical protein NDU88_007231 [Pleurodeles waltl]|uniref:Uncharacterized protein n=1 Tax=Pleurodeles waltl TaxID=8319 RepID=A0AAV7P1K6_PLEWA|nr:hypothetical protein NDU88_007231 [Pleurodeles waltl]